MLTPAEISAGTGRLTANKLTASDRETLLAVFRLYLKSLAGGDEFADLGDRLAAAEDSGGNVKTASKLAGVLILLEEKGFALAELKGGRSGLQTNVAGEMVLKIRFALTILGYDLPEEFSGAVETGNENISGMPGFFVPSFTVKQKTRW